ncbi:hypothetical protein DSCW_26180 [Desulfosarcina widdelii]|uniref:Ner winged helix-turn-helix DNA-binding domain-containing protein n=1 Tax=Desulfosarcina widdelii TaxID=947919 RepID=A0A5K7Z6A9_9BACT|nr:hypothetical protein DSCW_26180 [Desulfosarcina widdelii]
MNKNQRIAMAEKDLTVRKLSKILDRTEPHVSNVLGGRFKSPKLRERISLVLDKDVCHLWPEHEG